MLKLTVANTVTDLIRGDIDEHYSIQRIPLQGEVIGLGTTTQLDNGELCFQYDGEGQTHIYKGDPANGRAVLQPSASELIHFPYVCFTSDARHRGVTVDLAELPSPSEGLQAIAAAAIERLDRPADYYGIRLRVRWRSLVITVAAKLCLWQRRRFRRNSDADNVYESLRHFYFADTAGDPQHTFLGPSPDWTLTGFFARHPEDGLVTVPRMGANLHIHGCSDDLRFAGHVHHGHPSTQLLEVKSMRIYPIEVVEALKADLAIEDLRIEDKCLRFTVRNHSGMDVSNADIAIVTNNAYRGHRSIRIPWLAHGDVEELAYPLAELSLCAGENRIEAIANPDCTILEDDLSDNRAAISYMLR